MARIYKRGKSWYLDIIVKGRRIRRKVSTSKRIAELALKDAEVRVARQEFGFARKDIAIDDLIKKFLDYSRANHREASTIRYNSVLNNLRRFIEEKTKITFLSEVTTETIDQYKIFRKDSWVNPNGRLVESDDDKTEFTRKGIRAYTVNFELKTLNCLFNRAIKWGYLKDNPVKDVQRMKIDDTRRLKFLSIEECKRLLDVTPPNLYPIFFTFLNTGMRKGELENLEWTDIDFKRRKIKIQWKETWQPKTGEREIPIGEQLLDLLKKHKEKNDAGSKSNFVFPHKDSGKIKTKLRDKMIEIAKKAKIDGLTKLHTLRHTFASHLVMAGVDLPTVKKLMGHSDIQTTMIYAHLAPDHLANAVDKLPYVK